jgi:hypothetical protein
MAADVRAVLLARDKRLFFKRDAQTAKEPAHHRGVGFDAALGPKALAQRGKRDVRLLGPRSLRKITVRHQLGRPVAAMPTGFREPSRSTRSSHLIATDSLIS